MIKNKAIFLLVAFLLVNFANLANSAFSGFSLNNPQTHAEQFSQNNHTKVGQNISAIQATIGDFTLATHQSRSDTPLTPKGGILAPAKRTSGSTVLGKYPEYVNLSDTINARRFQIPDNVWARMSDAERWTANRKFLDRTISRGDDIILSNTVKSVNDVTGSFRKELDYLISQGFKLSQDGTRLIK